MRVLALWLIAGTLLACNGSAASSSAPPLLHRGDCTPFAVKGWDPDQPWPIAAVSVDGDRLHLVPIRVDDDGTLSCASTGVVSVWGFPPDDTRPILVFDGSTASVSGVIEGWGNKDPTLALERDADGWTTPEGYGVDSSGAPAFPVFSSRAAMWKMSGADLIYYSTREDLVLPWQGKDSRLLLPFFEDPAGLRYDAAFTLDAEGGLYPPTIGLERVWAY